jgi:hypothetical protein
MIALATCIGTAILMMPISALTGFGTITVFERHDGRLAAGQVPRSGHQLHCITRLAAGHNFHGVERGDGIAWHFHGKT